MILLGAWSGHTDRSRVDAADIRHAFAACGWSEKEAAALLDITPQQLSRQLAGMEPLNHWRLASLPESFHTAYDAIKAERRGARIVEPDVIQLIRWFEGAPRPALKADRRLVTLPVQQKEAV